MKIIITGAAGVIGTVLTRGLKNLHEVIGIDRKTARDCVTQDLSILTDETISLMKGADAVIHLPWHMLHNFYFVSLEI